MYVWVGPTFLGEYIVSYTITAQLDMIALTTLAKFLSLTVKFPLHTPHHSLTHVLKNGHLFLGKLEFIKLVIVA